jgi:hypothetical protein
MLLLAAVCLFGPCLGDLTEAMNRLKGLPIETAFERLGIPDQEKVIAGRKVFVWEAEHPDGPQCRIKIMESGGKVESWDAVGNREGCSIYMKWLKERR